MQDGGLDLLISSDTLITKITFRLTAYANRSRRHFCNVVHISTRLHSILAKANLLRDARTIFHAGLPHFETMKLTRPTKDCFSRATCSFPAHHLDKGVTLWELYGGIAQEYLDLDP